MQTIFIIVVSVLITILLVWLINKHVSAKAKPIVLIIIWAVIAYLVYLNFMNIYEPIQFEKVKVERYAKNIEKLKDLRAVQLAHRQVTGLFQKNFDSLVKFVDSAKFTITQRRDTTVVDQLLTRRYGVETTKDIVVVDTLGFVSVKDSLFGSSDRYKTLIEVPEGAGKPGAKYKMDAGVIQRNNVKVPVFEISIDKAEVFFEDKFSDFVSQQEEVVSVEDVNGPTLKVGSMEEVNTNGNWPKFYDSKKKR